MNSSRTSGGGQKWRSNGLVTYLTLTRKPNRNPIVPVHTFDPGNAIRFNNYLFVDVGDGMGTGDKIK